MGAFRIFSKFILIPALCLAVALAAILVIAFTFFRVGDPDATLGAAPQSIEIPDYFSDIWLHGQGLPIRYENIREGWSSLPGGGTMYILPFTTTALPYKNLKPTADWVAHVNETYHPDPAWSVATGLRENHFRCMAQSASTVSDWHALLLGHALPTYQNELTGRFEQGLDYKILDSIYVQRNKFDPREYYLNATKVFPDPVSHTPVPFSLHGFARILTIGANTDPQAVSTITDFNLPLTFHYAAKDFHLYQQPVQLFRNKVFLDVLLHREPPMSQQVVRALHEHGILYAGIKARFSIVNGNLRNTKLGFVPLAFFSGHGVAIVGYIEKDGHTYFIYRETFGLSDSDSSDAGVAYRMYPVYGFDEMYAFPEKLTLRSEKIDPGRIGSPRPTAKAAKCSSTLGKSTQMTPTPKSGQMPIHP